MLLWQREGFYGGAAGGGKSDALLMSALQYVDTPGYSALILRRTYADLSLPDAIMDRAYQWLSPTDARWNEKTKTWTFPSGATLTFGYLQRETDKYRYQGAQFQFVAFDELTQFTESQYLYLFSRLRRLQNSRVPLRARAASNPGGEGHEWVYERFVAAGKNPERIFIPAKLEENPHLDQAEYELSLAELDDTTKAQLLEGAWVTDPEGKPFKRDWWRGQNRYDATDRGIINRVIARFISIDTAMKDKTTSDYTAVTVAELWPDYRLSIREVWRDKLQFPDLPELILDYAKQYNADDKLWGIIIEDKGSGTSAHQTLMASAEDWVKERLVAFSPQGDKLQRARQAAVWCKRGCVLMPQPNNEAPWLANFERELFEFPEVSHDDRVDTLSQLLIYTEHLLAEGWRARGMPVGG